MAPKSSEAIYVFLIFSDYTLWHQKDRFSIISAFEAFFVLWGAIGSDERKMFFSCSNKLNAVTYMETLNNYKGNMHFSGLYSVQDNASVHKSENYWNFFPRKGVEGTEMASIYSRCKSNWNFLGNFEAATMKKCVLGKRRKCVKNLEQNWRRCR